MEHALDPASARAWSVHGATVPFFAFNRRPNFAVYNTLVRAAVASSLLFSLEFAVTSPITPQLVAKLFALAKLAPPLPSQPLRVGIAGWRRMPDGSLVKGGASSSSACTDIVVRGAPPCDAVPASCFSMGSAILMLKGRLFVVVPTCQVWMAATVMVVQVPPTEPNDPTPPIPSAPPMTELPTLLAEPMIELPVPTAPPTELPVPSAPPQATVAEAQDPT